MSPAKRPDGSGTTERRGDRVFGRVGLSDGSRPKFLLGVGITDDAARSKLDTLVDSGRKNGNLDELVLRLVGDRVRQKRAAAAVTVAGTTTVRQLGELWTSGELAK